MIAADIPHRSSGKGNGRVVQGHGSALGDEYLVGSKVIGYPVREKAFEGVRSDDADHTKLAKNVFYLGTRKRGYDRRSVSREI
jgi:hypothetical protein